MLRGSPSGLKADVRNGGLALTRSILAGVGNRIALAPCVTGRTGLWIIDGDDNTTLVGGRSAAIVTRMQRPFAPRHGDVAHADNPAKSLRMAARAESPCMRDQFQRRAGLQDLDHAMQQHGLSLGDGLRRNPWHSGEIRYQDRTPHLGSMR
jgi:hypothetical protein